MTLRQTSAGRDLRMRYVYLGLAMCLGLLVLAIRLYRLQITQYDEYASKSVDNFVKKIRIPADRGMIKDRRNEILVDNRPSYDLFVTPAFCQRCSEEVLPKLAQLLSWDDALLQHAKDVAKAGKPTAPFQPALVKVDLSRDELDLVSAHKMELPGVDVLSVPHRNYRLGTSLAHLLGYMNEITEDELQRLNAEGSSYALGDYIGRRGVERAFEAKLRGVDGIRKEVVNARGEPIPGLSDLIGSEDWIAPIPGQNVVLSIDVRLQQEAEKQFPGVAGAMVVLEARTGFILAIVSRPSFDPNVLTGRVTAAQMAALSKDPLQPLVYRPVAQQYSPGSTFKPMTELAALKSGQFTTHSSYTCPGGYRLGSRVWHCHKKSGHGLVDAQHALQLSCDTYFYHVADTIGLDPIAEMALSMGLGAPTGIGVVAEVPGIIPTREYHNRRTPGGYTKGMALNSAIGQGDVTVTPLQLAVTYAAIGNGGVVYQPQVVSRVESVDGRVDELHPIVLRNVNIPPEHTQLVVAGLTAVVNEPGGTAYRARIKGIKYAGKTGTAQVVRLGNARVKDGKVDYWSQDHAWFAAFAPAQDPEIAVVVLNEHGGHGGNAAAPAAAAVIQKYFDLKDVDKIAQKAHRSLPEPGPPPIPETPRAPTGPAKSTRRVQSYAQGVPVTP